MQKMYIILLMMLITMLLLLMVVSCGNLLKLGANPCSFLSLLGEVLFYFLLLLPVFPPISLGFRNLGPMLYECFYPLLPTEGPRCCSLMGLRGKLFWWGKSLSFSRSGGMFEEDSLKFTLKPEVVVKDKFVEPESMLYTSMRSKMP